MLGAGWVAVLSTFAAWPALLHAGLAREWPGAMGTLWRVWPQPPRVQQASWEPASGLLRRAQGWWRRYTRVKRDDLPKWSQIVNALLLPAPNISFKWVFIPMVLVYMMNREHPPAKWDVAQPALSLMARFLSLTMPAWLILAMSMVLVVKDLHWRRRLTPGGVRPSRLGSHIFLSTLRFASVHAIPTVVVLALW